ncbi:von Willebrand factor D and EGF domain-containing protein-like [Glandiceps talaboti]
MPLSMILSLALITIVVGQEPDPCANYVDIDDEIRSTAFETDQTLAPEYMLCDDNLPFQWYRFISGAGGQLATDEAVPRAYTCGTHIPIYMMGSHPDTDTPEERTVCGDALGFSCLDTWKIEVKKCTGYYVYKLRSVNGCTKAYCAGTLLRCPEGKNSPTGFGPPCTSSFPKLSSNPVLTVNVEEQLIKQQLVNIPVFHCSFESELNVVHRGLYKVDWYVEDELVWTDNLSEDTNDQGSYKATLSQFSHPILQNEGLYTLGQTIKCAVTSSFEGSDTTSEARYSIDFYAGIRAHEQEIFVKENGSPQTITLTTSVPVVCEGQATNCDVQAGVKSDDDTGFKDCVVSFYNTDGPDTVKILEVVKRPDQPNHPDQTFIVEFSPFEGTNPFYFRNHRPVYVTVHTEDKKSASCTALGDPHYTTFDGRYYHWFGVGDHVMVKPKVGKEADAYYFTVHTRLIRCPQGSSPSCNCAVAVREGYDVAIIDGCGTEFVFYVHRHDEHCDPAFKATVRQNEIQVDTPSGQRVKIRGRTYMDVYIDVNGAMLKNIEGLCGLFDGEITTDNYYRDKDTNKLVEDTSCGVNCRMPFTFPKAYRLDYGTSLFFPVAWSPGDGLPPSYPKCICEKDENDPDGQNVINCKSIGDPMMGNIDGTEWFSCEDVQRRRRVADESYSDDAVYNPYAYELQEDDTDVVVSNNTWPTESGITEGEAIQKCNETLSLSNILSTCEEIDSMLEKISNSLDECVYDIQLTDSLVFLDNVRTAVESACTFEIYSNTSLWVPDDNGDIAPPAQIVKAVCPNHCSKHGQCGLDGNCTCNDGYTAVDCSIEIGVPPVIDKILSGTACDVRYRPCERITLSATGVLNSNSFSCIILELEYSMESKSWTETGNVWITPAEFLTAYLAYCYLPTIGIHRRSLPDVETTIMYKAFGISLSNDGEISSNQQFLRIFDSLCVNCTDDDDCFLKENTCFINGKCYSADEINPYDPCLSCVPEKAIDSWISGTDLDCTTDTILQHQETATKQKWVIPVASVAALVTLVVTIVVIWNVLKHCKKRTKKTASVASFKEMKTISKSVINDGDIGVYEDMD